MHTSFEIVLKHRSVRRIFYLPIIF
ncbi:unnamed protein product [Acanthoscelides obtectus]|uniref:Uncharacterized protein n=1 Tax=Acanthoscelides obtectus TaxID=200917 RepID=A0A9P0Q049_ACAOB|nr:unnamed protein product [Acanthoscelides obtectus]CAK1657432.1 hypothetical protein AOBTE_LOCUS20341 [Acanthoscelides obtectus]